MPDQIPFITPRLVGRRFNEVAVPLKLLKDFAVFEDLIVQTAKLCYLEANPNRKRVRGLTDGISIRLTGIESGSTKLAIALFLTATGLFPPENQEHYEKARSRIISAVDAAERGEDATEHLPRDLLKYFNRFAAGLKEDEAIEFRPENAARPARLNRETRRRLVKAAAEDLTEEMVLRGTIPELDQQRKTFETELWNGRRVKGAITSELLDPLLRVFNGYRNRAKVQFQATVRLDPANNPKQIETVTNFNVLDPNDVPARLDEFRALRDGWLDGDGVALDSAGLDWLADAFEANYPDDLELPYLFPMPNGGVRAEWTIGQHEVSLDVNLRTHQADWHDLNLASDEGNEREIDLSLADGWRFVIDQIRTLAGGQ